MLPDAGPGSGRARGADRGRRSAPDTDGSRRRHAPRRLAHRELVFSSLPEPCVSIRALSPWAALHGPLRHGGPPGNPNGRPLSGSAGLGVGTLLQPPEHIVEVEAGRLLALRI